MTRATFFKHFELLADQPDAVVKMRELVLQLAVQGRLVPQNPTDESGTKLVARMSRKELPDADHILDARFPRPWAITAFANLASIRSGVTKGRNLAGRKTKSFPYLRVANVQRGHLDLEVMKDIEIPVEELVKFRLQPNDLLVTEGGDWDKVGRTAIWRGEIVDCLHQNHVFRGRLVSGELQPEWFMLYFNSPVGRRYFETAAKQTTNLASINASELRECPVPLPPLAEQRRIVAKVDELMALCDELEQRQQARQHARGHVTQSAYHHLTAAKDPAEFRHRFHFILQHSAFILDDVPQLRQAILQLAVQGRLLTKAQPTSELSLGELLAEPSVNGVSKAPSQTSLGTEILRISAGTSRRDFFVNEDDFKHVQLTDREIEKFRLRANDLLACRFNGNLRYVGRFSLYRAISGRTQVNSDKLIRFRIDESRFLPRFVCYAMNALPTRIKIEVLCATTAGNIGISASELKEVSIPIPPLAEQKRIVARVEELLRWCATLEGQLHQTRTLGAHLLASTLHHLLAA